MTNPVSELRAASGLSWAEIGEITGSHRTTVMRWEKDEWDIPKGMRALLERLVAEHKAAKRRPARRKRNWRAGR